MSRLLTPAAVVALALALSPAVAQPDRQGPGGGRQFGQQPIDPERDEVLAHIRGAVSPTDEQWARIVARYEEFRTAQREAMREMMRQGAPGERPQREPGERPERPDRPDRPDRQPGEFDRGAMRERMEAALKPINDAFLADCRAILGPEQREMFDACTEDIDLTPRMGMRRGGPDGARPPMVGDQAPAFELRDLDGRTVTLASLRSKPTVVEFGSYTCPIFRGKVADFTRLREEFGDRVNWVLVYTREAHPTDGRVVAVNTRVGIEVPQHRTAEDRLKCATLAKDKLGLGVTVLVDTIDDTVTRAFGGFPNRGYILDADGKVASRQVWIDPKETAATLRRLLGMTAPPPAPQNAPRPASGT